MKKMSVKPPKNDDSKDSKTGPKPDTILVDGDWTEAVGKALKKKKPESGWPKDGKKS